MVSAVPQFPVVDGGFLGALPCLFLDAGNFFPLCLGSLDFLLNHRDNVHVHVEVVVQVLGDKVIDKGAYGGAAVRGGGTIGAFHLLFPHVGRAQFGLGLAFKDGLLDLDGDGAHNALADVLRLVVLLVEVLEGLGNGLTVGRQMGAAVTGVLAVDKGGYVFPVAVAMGKHNLNVFSLQVDQGIERGLAHVLRHQVQQAVFTLVRGAVEYQREAFLEVGIVLDHGLHKFHVEGIVVEQFLVRGEADVGAVFFCRGDYGAFQQFSAAETGIGALAFPVRCYIEFRRHGVDGLGTHAVHAHALFEVGVVELAAGVQFGRGVHHLAQRNAPAEVPHRNAAVLNGNVYALAEAHGKLIYGIVHNFLQKHIDAVSLPVAIPQTADVHAGAPPDVLVPFQGLDGVVVVAGIDDICHIHSKTYKVKKKCADKQFCLSADNA